MEVLKVSSKSNPNLFLQTKRKFSFGLFSVDNFISIILNLSSNILLYFKIINAFYY